MSKETLKNTAISAILGLAAAAAAPATAYSADSASTKEAAEPEGEAAFNVVAALRTWYARWDLPTFVTQVVVPNPSNPASAVIQQQVVPAVADAKFLFLPSLGFRAGNFIATVSGMPSTQFTTPGSALGSIDRQEVDVNVGYYVLPGIVALVGYKRAELGSFTPQSSAYSSKIDAWLIGGSASAPLSDRISLYGNFAYGFAQQTYDTALVNGDTRMPGSYQIAEVGVTYRLLERETGLLKGISLQAGYRFQSYVTSATLGTFSPSAPTVPIAITKTDLRSTTDGLILGVVGVF